MSLLRVHAYNRALLVSSYNLEARRLLETYEPPIFGWEEL